MADGLISVVFQPIVNIASGATFAFEALARSRAKDLDTPPTLFEAAVAQRVTGKLGRRIRDLATVGCPDHALFLNVHPAELSDRWLVQPDDPIFTHGPGAYLEITESVPLSHHKIVTSILAEIRSKGVGIVVDDLGAGYSNLRYIADLAPDLVKVDRGLVEGLGTDKRRQRLLAAVVRLCTDLGSEVVAEGIETEDELGAVRDAGVRYAQGYLIGRPGRATVPEAPPTSRKRGPRSEGARRRHRSG
jgi:EAL domain-containing protein (putative c-di-GMP-specific phosphodiesterase class I)